MFCPEKELYARYSMHSTGTVKKAAHQLPGKKENEQMKRLDYGWSSNPDWWHYNDDGERVINDDAPELVKESYRHYLSQLADADRETERRLVIPRGRSGWDYYREFGVNGEEKEDAGRNLEFVDIPYEETLSLRASGAARFLTDLCQGSVRVLTRGEIQRCIEKTLPIKNDVPVFLAGLRSAYMYNTPVVYMESHSA